MSDVSLDVSLEISEKEPGAYSVKLDGKELSNCIHSLRYEAKAGELATITICFYVEGVQINTPAVWEIPDTYQLCTDGKGPEVERIQIPKEKSI